MSFGKTGRKGTSKDSLSQNLGQIFLLFRFKKNVLKHSGTKSTVTLPTKAGAKVRRVSIFQSATFIFLSSLVLRKRVALEHQTFFDAIVCA
jgi:hypothetical protein